QTGPSKPDKGKCIATGTEDSPVKLKKASKELEKAEKVKIVELSKPELGKWLLQKLRLLRSQSKEERTSRNIREQNEKVKKIVDIKKRLYDQF
ncbi:hypothetical protein Tco_0043453, partial [Tanacetum coccineum]